MPSKANTACFPSAMPCSSTRRQNGVWAETTAPRYHLNRTENAGASRRFPCTTQETRTDGKRTGEPAARRRRSAAGKKAPLRSHALHIRLHRILGTDAFVHHKAKRGYQRPALVPAQVRQKGFPRIIQIIRGEQQRPGHELDHARIGTGNLQDVGDGLRRQAEQDAAVDIGCLADHGL